ncbi:HAD family hydrolase [Magnetococcales bacterium HHB-1]
MKPFIYLDIGSTLLGGPDKGPVSQFMEKLELSRNQRANLIKLLFTEDYSNAEELARMITDRFNLSATQLSRTTSITKKIWDNQVDHRALSYKVGIKKPDRKIFDHAQNLIDKGRPAIMIGDTYYYDIQPALELGWHAIWTLHRPQKEKQASDLVKKNQKPQPTYTVKNINDIQLEWLRK